MADDRNDKPAPAPMQRWTGWPRVGASMIVFRERSVLLVKRAKPPVTGLWSLPGGHVEPGETAADAALRELGEETGVAAEMLGLVDINDVIIRDEVGELRAHYVIAVHAGRWLSGEAVAASDADDAGFHPISELAALDMTPRAQSIIETALVTYAQVLGRS